MAKELQIKSEEVVFEIDKNGREDIIGKIIETGDGKVAVDFRIYWFDKEDELHESPKHSAKGLWMDPETAKEVGLAMVEAAEKALKMQKGRK